MLELKHVSKIYHRNREQLQTVKDFSLAVPEGSFVALVGPSGCGKTTLLKIIGGLLLPSSGEVILDGKHISGPAKERGLVFQSFTLFPWLTVKENISFGPELQRLSRAKTTEIVDHYLQITGLQDFAEFYPKDLSGGMQQRVAIARTLANDPKIVLMDEPFGSLDAQTRLQMQEFLLEIYSRERKTVVFITHDVEEAAFLADMIYVLTARPSQIKKVFEVPFARPRGHEIKHTTEFFKFATKVAKELEIVP